MNEYRIPVLQYFCWQDPVLDKDLTAPPETPTKGDRYIVASSATGDWAGEDGNIAMWTGEEWDFTIAKEGMFCFVLDEHISYYFITEWIERNYYTKSEIDAFEFLTEEEDPLSLHLDQTEPQTIVNGVPLMTTPVDEYGSGNQLVNMAYVRGGTWLMPPIIEWYDPVAEGGLPADPDVGDRYGCDGTGYGWTIDYIYEWDGSEWIESAPEEGWMLWCLFEMLFYIFFSGGWMVDGEYTYVPYTGAIYDVDLGEKNITANNLAITNWNTAYSHSQIVTGNPHSLDYADIGLSANQVIDWTDTNQNFLTTGTLGAGAITGTRITSQALTSHGYLDVYGASGYAAEVNLGRAGSRIWHFGMDVTNKFNFVESYVKERLSILPGGKIGLTVTAPDRRLEINTGAGTEGIRISYNDSNGSATTYADFLLDSSGDLAITATGGNISFGNANLSTTGTLGAGATTITAFLKVGTGYSAPTIVAGSGAGASPTVFITGGNSAGEITLTTGTTALPNDDLLAVTFSVAFTNAPAVILYPSNGNACALSGATAIYVVSTTGTFTLWSGTTELADSTEYRWFYHCIGT